MRRYVNKYVRRKETHVCMCVNIGNRFNIAYVSIFRTCNLDKMDQFFSLLRIS